MCLAEHPVLPLIFPCSLVAQSSIAAELVLDTPGKSRFTDIVSMMLFVPLLKLTRFVCGAILVQRNLLPLQPSLCATERNNLVSVATWNCRGFQNSKPYIVDLIKSGVDIIILQEHWLWPFELSTLDSVHPQYDFTAISDKQVHASSNLVRGCGGIAIFWNKALPCFPISALDRVCGVRLLPSTRGHSKRYLTILGVYMPSADEPQETYTSYLEIVEHAVSQFSNDARLVVMGDLNAHLGSRVCDNPQPSCNSRGQQWLNLCESLSLHNISSSSLSSGPSYTYSSGSHISTVDYMYLGTVMLLEESAPAILWKSIPLTHPTIFPSTVLLISPM